MTEKSTEEKIFVDKPPSTLREEHGLWPGEQENMDKVTPIPDDKSKIPLNRFHNVINEKLVTEMKKSLYVHETFDDCNVSKLITARFKEDNVKFFCNDNISEYLRDNELQYIELEVANNIETLLRSLLIDIDNDHNTKETGKRVAKMFIHEVFAGRFKSEPKITSFPNAAKYDGAYYTGPISVRSTCAHHFQNITGNCWVGVKPEDDVIGLSKFNRIIDWIASRPQIQEEMTVQIADKICELTKTKNIAILLKAKHHCITHRGVKEHDSDMTTTILRGSFQTESNIRNEFFATVNNMKGHGHG